MEKEGKKHTCGRKSIIEKENMTNDVLAEEGNIKINGEREQENNTCAGK